MQSRRRVAQLRQLSFRLDKFIEVDAQQFKGDAKVIPGGWCATRNGNARLALSSKSIFLYTVYWDGHWSVPPKLIYVHPNIRYTGKSISKKDQVEYFHFEWVWQSQNVVATLVTTSFFIKRYMGSGRTQQLAEMSAFELFRNDPDVLEVCRNVPPPLENIRRRVQMKSYQKEALTAEGHDPAAIFKQLGDDLYLAFRDMGCRTATWDFNIWMRARPPGNCLALKHQACRDSVLNWSEVKIRGLVWQW